MPTWKQSDSPCAAAIRIADRMPIRRARLWLVQIATARYAKVSHPGRGAGSSTAKGCSMDARSVLGDLLQQGQELLRQGKNVAEKGLNLPQEGPERAAAVSGLKKGAAVGGILALLLGTRAGRRLGGSALKLGSLAAVGTIAWRAFQNWQKQSSGQSSEANSRQFVAELAGNEANERSLLLLRAMISAAKADGHVQDEERRHIQEHLASLDLDGPVRALFEQELDRPVDVAALVKQARTLPEAAEMYLVSCYAIDIDDSRERAYLNELASGLGLDPKLAEQIEAEPYR